MLRQVKPSQAQTLPIHLIWGTTTPINSQTTTHEYYIMDAELYLQLANILVLLSLCITISIFTAKHFTKTTKSSLLLEITNGKQHVIIRLLSVPNFPHDWILYSTKLVNGITVKVAPFFSLIIFEWMDTRLCSLPDNTATYILEKEFQCSMWTTRKIKRIISLIKNIL